MRRLVNLSLVIAATALFLASCVPVSHENLNDVVLDLSDSTQIEILKYQDQQQRDSLISLFKHEDATYRFLSARAFSSIEDPRIIDPLAALLKDDVFEVRQQAAFSLGQQKDGQALPWLIETFASQDSTKLSHQFMATALEAVGKTGTEKELNQIASVTTYLPTDTALVEGQLWAIYRFATRGITSKEGTERCVEVLTGTVFPYQARWVAAQYLARAKNIDLTSHSAVLNNALTREKEPDILMALAKASGKCQAKTNRTTLIDLFNSNVDDRVRLSIMQAFNEKGDDPTWHEILINTLKDSNPHLSLYAAQSLQKLGNTEEANLYKNIARDTSVYWATRIALFKAAQLQFPFYYSISKGAINRDLNNWLRIEKDPYKQGAITNALAADPKNYQLLLNRLGHEHPYTRTQAASGLKEILDHPEFEIVLEPGWKYGQKEWLLRIKEAIQNGDPGVIYELSQLLTHPKLAVESFDELRYLDTALLRLSLPEHVETYRALEKAIATLQNKPYVPSDKTFLGHPPRWDLLLKGDLPTQAEMETNVGSFTMDLLWETAPVTCLNFIDLVERGYFEGKNFHRVVPNFVIQGGCPRGDGYGSLNYTIRSELNPSANYRQAGAVGMASAGKHTECTQWFVTHSPTPHLDGNYSMFAQVSAGMNVIQKVQQNDIIRQIRLINPK